MRCGGSREQHGRLGFKHQFVPPQPAPETGGEWSEPYYVKGQGWLIADKEGCVAQARDRQHAAHIVADHNAATRKHQTALRTDERETVAKLMTVFQAAKDYQPSELIEQIEAALNRKGEGQ